MSEVETSHGPTVCVVVALPLEARPIIDAWMLRRIQDVPFAVYEGELPGPRTPVLLLVSGVGRVAAAAGVSWLGAQVAGRSVGRSVRRIIGRSRAPGKATLWINYGVAGASKIAGVEAHIGQSVLAAKVVDEERRRVVARNVGSSDGKATSSSDRRDQGNGKNSGLAKMIRRVPTWYPPWVVGRAKVDSGLADTERATVYTVDGPELECAGDGVYEMEAAGFMETALRFSTAELVQVLKVVSDTPARGVEALDRSTLKTCCKQGMRPLTALAQSLVALVQEEGGPEDGLSGSSPGDLDVSHYASELRLSVTESHQWNRLVERIVALRGAKAVKTVVEQAVEGQPRRPVLALQAVVDRLALGDQS